MSVDWRDWNRPDAVRVRAEQLGRHLKGTLAPVYLVIGDEPLQAGEALDAIVAAARASGFASRDTFTAGHPVRLGHAARGDSPACRCSPSAASSICALPEVEPGDAGAALLRGYAGSPSPDSMLAVTAPKADGRAQWVKALEQGGVAVEVRPVAIDALPEWLRSRAATRGLRLSSEAAALLAERAEGNLLAAAQELSRLALLHPDGEVDEAAVREAVSDSARFDVFEFADTALAGDAARVVRMLEGLREEGVAAQLVCWLLLRDLRALAPVAHDLATGMSMDCAMNAHNVWPKRRPVSQAALRRHPGKRWLELLAMGFTVDAVVKGAPGSPWDALERLGLAVCGVRLGKD